MRDIATQHRTSTGERRAPSAERLEQWLVFGREDRFIE
jgi:hypothetical protein